ncbi:MAG: hypothetical protein UR68_C0038G0009 [Candidatus Roizmanbacteria bacterium GW2011_GWA2_35_19]|uniref:VWFA domain-containing protein n=2 Tax=Candidatus Roizmaniibacteriota TaxID=1752723 RepID=A0A0G0EUB6_9BACT|nr:MAG: hypothetical protein UR63_C0004G0034 [Candidatus Roizmanbacteria bacterium GW2011_GWC2_35_12]KKP70822.1 MAG: hypothetical protein UR68_C0038G0009 [Candidatus Roizmanbacteria bacterium GW2011_GWA2_35_19]
MQLIKKYFNGQTLKLAGLIGLLFLGAGVLIIPSIMESQQNLSVQRSKAAEPVPSSPPASCDVRFIVSEATPILTPTTIITPTEMPTPTLVLTSIPTPTPVLNCKNLDIALVVDRSSTMNSSETDGRTKLAWAKEAMRIFVESLRDNTSPTSQSTVRVSVDSFGRRGNKDLPEDSVLRLGTLLYPTNVPDPNDYNSILHTPLSSDLNGVVLPAISSVNYILPGTCIQCGLYLANEQLLASTADRRAVILLSDGMSNKVWNGDNPHSSICYQAAVDQANIGRVNGIEFKVLGYGKRDQSPAQIEETTLKRIACADPNDTTCVNNNYAYKPNAYDWVSAYLTILNDLCK